jgi:hypothetical protein
VTSRRIKVNKVKIEIVEKFEFSTNIKEVRNFLGHCGFYRKFIKNSSQIAKPMTNLLVKDFTEECMEAFNESIFTE